MRPGGRCYDRRFPTPADCPLSQTGTSGSWLRRNGIYYCANQVQDSASFGSWFVDSAYSNTVPGALTLLRCPAAGEAGTPPSICTPADANTFLFDSSMMLPNDGTGTDADIIRRAMIRMEPALNDARVSAKMLLQVHDELVFEVPEEEAEKAMSVIARVMAKAAEPAVLLSVPLQVDAHAASNWDEAH